MGVPTATDFTEWLKKKMGMELKEFEALPQGAKHLIYFGFKGTWRGNPGPQKEIRERLRIEERVREEGKYRDILEAIRIAIVEPISTKEELYLKAREKSVVAFTYGEFIGTLSELLKWGLVVYRDGKYWR